MLRRLISRLGAGSLLLAGLTAGSLSASSGTSIAGPPAFRMDWSPCSGAPTVQCGTLQVPVDWAKPGGPRVPLAVARRPADNPAARIGTLFYNPGGPGDGAARYVRNAEQFFSPTVLTRFDLVGLDPRGTGDRVKAQCGVNPIVPETTLFPRTAQQFEQLRRHNREVGLSCLQQ